MGNKFGCRIPRDPWPDYTFPVCDDLDEFGKYEEMFNLHKNVLLTITELTGCLAPCNYWEYKMQGKPNKVGPESWHGIILWATTPYVTVETEELIYPLASLVAEFGGTLSLFLGFSFMAVWDGLGEAWALLKTIKKNFKSETADLEPK